jgi:hypothetical protein
MTLATLLIVTGGLLGQPAPGSLQIATEGLIQVAIAPPEPPEPPTPPSGGLVSGGHAQGRAYDRGDENRRIEENNLIIMAVIKKFLDDST